MNFMDVDSNDVQLEMIASYPTVCRPCADNVKAIYSLVLTFARRIELQPVSLQRVLSGEGNAIAPLADMPEPASDPHTDSKRRPPPPIPGRRGPRNSISSASIAQGLKVALFAMGAPKLFPQR